MKHSAGFLKSAMLGALIAMFTMAIFSTSAGAWTTDPYSWGTVAVGGGGACPQLVIHPKVQDVMYLSSDVGGLHRWDPVNQKWISLLDFMRSNPDDNSIACASVAVDPSDTTGNTVWAACGLYDWTKGEVMKSTDRGATWQRNSKGLFAFGGNIDQHHRQRLAVDPKNGNICYAASRDALYRTTDGGVTWAKLTGAPTGDITKLGSGGGDCGNQVVIIDPSSSTLSSPTRAARIYLGPLGSPVYKSEDGGTTWSAMSGAPTSIANAAVSSMGVLYCTNGSGVYKYTGGASGTWSTTTPAAASYGWVAIDPFNNSNVLVVQKTSWQSVIWHSTDAGSTWTSENMATDNVTYNPTWYVSNWFGGDTDCIAYDPFRQNVVWESDIVAAYKTTNITTIPTAWTCYISGHEEGDITCALISPPTGSVFLYSGAADIDGFTHTSLTSYPNQIRIGYVPGQWYQLVTGADFEEANPSFAAFCGQGGWSSAGAGGYTTDGGVTFHDYATNPTNFGGRVAVSANSQTIVWATSNANPPSGRYIPSYSTDLGASWHTCTGAPGMNLGYNVFNWNSPLCSDRKNGAKFYIYNDDGTVYRSTDTGHTFTQVASGLPADGNKANIIANPYVEGDLWLSLEGSGLYHSTDSGSTWTHLANVQNAYMVTVGKGPSANVASIYVMGMVDSDANEGVFRSDNAGSAWFKVDVTTPYPGRGPNFMCGDRQTYGTVYVGTNIGIYYGQRGSSAPTAPTGLTASAGNAQVALSWTASSGATSYNVKRSTINGSGYATVASPTTTNYTNTGLTNGTTYYYVVTAVNTSGESGNSNQASATPSAPVQAQIIAGTATIDGVAEAAWNSATAYTLTKTTGTISGAADCSATWKGMWDATNLYILVNVTDDVKTNDSVNPWDDDAIEVYLDADHNGGTVYDANDRQIVCGWGDAAPVEGAARAIAGAAFGKTDPTGTTYIIEAKIPWAIEAFTPAANAIIGIDVHVDDDDDGGARDGKVIWNDGTDQAWNNPSLFGAGKLNAASGAPAAPTGLIATAGNAQVALSWTASTGATSYNVKRSTVSGSGYVTVSSPTTTSYTNTGLTNGTTYYYVVTAVNSGGESGNSNQASATPQPPIPAAPTGLTGTAGNAQVALSWTASSGATSYNVKRSTVSGSGYAQVANVATTSYTNTGLTNGTTYYFVVSALNGGGESANSAQASATPTATVPQAQIANGTPVIDGAVDAVWSNATSYTMTKTTGTISSSADCSGSWQGLWDATNLYILVNVTDDVKVNDSVNPWDDDAVEIYLDADHNGGTVYDANDRQIVCGWGDAAPVEGGGRAIAGAVFGKADPTGTTYRIEAKIPWAIEAFTPAVNSVIGVDVHIDDDDDGGARDGKVIWNDGTDQAWTNPSLMGTGKLNVAGSVPAAPTSLTATAGISQVALSWTASTTATSYNVKRSTVSGSGYVTVSSPTATSYTNTGLTNGTTYYFVVTGVNSAGESANSAQASAAPNSGNTHAGIWSCKGVLTGTASFKNIANYPACTANTTYTASFWLKGSGSVTLRVLAGGWGAQIAQTGYTATSTWTLCSFTFSTGANTSLTYDIYDSSTTAGTVYIDDCFCGIANGTNVLGNPGFESGNVTWGIDTGAPFTIVQNP